MEVKEEEQGRKKGREVKGRKWHEGATEGRKEGRKEGRRKSRKRVKEGSQGRKEVK